MGEAVRVCLTKYATFEGRARRAEYWWFTLFNILAGLVLGVADTIILGPSESEIGLLSGLFNLAMLVPSLSVLVRRLHDTGRSGWWFWILLIPVIGWIVMLVFLATEGDRGPNGHGADPLRRDPTDDPTQVTGLSQSNVPRVPRR